MTTPSNTPQPQPLEYGLSPPRWRRRLGQTLLLTVLVLLGLSAWSWGPALWRQVQILYWQRQCMSYTAAADQVVYEEDPELAAKLLATGWYFVYPLARWTFPDENAKVRAAARGASCWGRINWPKTRSGLLPPPSDRGAVAFLHECISPSGNKRLVCVDYFAQPDAFSSRFEEGVNYEACVLIPATWTSPMSWTRRVDYDHVRMSQHWPRDAPLVRMYAGQPDANDPSHFTIRYQMWGQEDTLDGYLLDDDTVTLIPRNPPRETRP